MNLEIARKRQDIAVDLETSKKIYQRLIANGFKPLLRSFKERFFAEIGFSSTATEKDILLYSMMVTEYGLADGDLFLGSDHNLLFLKVIEDGERYRERIQGSNIDPGESFPSTCIEVGEIGRQGQAKKNTDFDRFCSTISDALAGASQWMDIEGYRRNFEVFDLLFDPPSTHDMDVVTILEDEESKVLLRLLHETDGVVPQKFIAEKNFSPEKFEERIKRMKAANLIDQSCLIVSRKTGQPINRLQRKEDVEILDRAGVRSPAGLLLSQEEVLDFLTITDHGHSMISSSFLLSFPVMEALESLGILPDRYRFAFNLSQDHVAILMTFDANLLFLQMVNQELTQDHAKRISECLISCDADRGIIVTTQAVTQEIKTFFEHIPLKSPVVFIESLNTIRAGIQSVLEEIRQATVVSLLEDYTSLSAMNISTVMLSKLQS